MTAQAISLGHLTSSSLVGIQITLDSLSYISTGSDAIAIGVIHSVVGTGGPLIPFRGGRIDATQAGPEGVPTPDQDISDHIESFRKQGFNQEEMIGLVACGHAIGGVRSKDFSQIVPDPPNDTLPSGEIQFFDLPAPATGSNQDIFDEKV